VAIQMKLTRFQVGMIDVEYKDLHVIVSMDHLVGPIQLALYPDSMIAFDRAERRVELGQIDIDTIMQFVKEELDARAITYEIDGTGS
jgi:hypothetical protein